MKILKTLCLTSTLAAIATIPFVLPNKHEVVRCAYTPTPVDSDIKQIKEKLDKMEDKVGKLEHKIDKAQLCKVKKDVEELKKIVYALIGVIGGSGALVGTTNVIKKKKK